MNFFNNQMDYQEDVTMMHGPRSSAERLDRRKSMRTKADEKRYFEERQRKLEMQNQPEIVSDIFKNVVAYFTGFTEDSSALDLRKKLQANSGKIRMFFYPGQTTHIICTNLCGAKALSMLRRIRSKSRRMIHVVHPDWILKSHEAKKRLPERTFALIEPNGGGTLDSFLLQSTDSDCPPGSRSAGNGICAESNEIIIAGDDEGIDFDNPPTTQGPAKSASDARVVSGSAHPLKRAIASNSQLSKLQSVSTQGKPLKSPLATLKEQLAQPKGAPFKQTQTKSPSEALVAATKLLSSGSSNPSLLGLQQVPKGQRLRSKDK